MRSADGLSVIMQIIIEVNVEMLSGVMLSVIMLSVIMLSVIRLSALRLSGVVHSIIELNA